jgi:hypothetical protein
VIPTIIVLGLFVGLLPIRPSALVAAVLLLGTAWGVLVAVWNDAYFPGGLALGAANAAVGVVFGAGLRSVAQGLVRGCVSRRAGAR